MRRDACAGAACLLRSKRYRIPPKQKKRKSSIDLDRGSASRARNFRQARDDSARNIVETLRACASLAKRRHRLAGVPPNANARIDLHLAKNRHAISDRGFRSFTVAEDVNRLATVRARK